VRKAGIAPPQPLRELASITDFNLFVEALGANRADSERQKQREIIMNYQANSNRYSEMIYRVCGRSGLNRPRLMAQLGRHDAN
jgi:hypothetical protein